MLRIAFLACVALAGCNPVTTTTTTVTPGTVVPGTAIAPAAVTTTSY
ncbi:MAG: hypothetical protein ABIV25_05255 [Paracoccaceae bacterium]